MISSSDHNLETDGMGHTLLFYVMSKEKRVSSRKQGFLKMAVGCSCPILECSFSHKTNPSWPNLPVPKPDGNMEYSSDSKQSDMSVVSGDDTCKPKEDNKLVPLTQAELNDLTQNLNLSKESA